MFIKVNVVDVALSRELNEVQTKEKYVNYHNICSIEDAVYVLGSYKQDDKPKTAFIRFSDYSIEVLGNAEDLVSFILETERSMRYYLGRLQ